MTRTEYDRLSLDDVQALLRSKGAGDAVVEAAMMAALEENDDAVLAYINGDKSALTEYTSESSDDFECINATSMSSEHRKRCNVGGKGLCNTNTMCP